jgi:hypothetical protein
LFIGRTSPPRVGRSVTRPSVSNRRSASRTGMWLTPSLVAKSMMEKLPGANSPQTIECRICTVTWLTTEIGSTGTIVDSWSLKGCSLKLRPDVVSMLTNILSDRACDPAEDSRAEVASCRPERSICVGGLAYCHGRVSHPAITALAHGRPGRYSSFVLGLLHILFRRQGSGSPNAEEGIGPFRIRRAAGCARGIHFGRTRAPATQQSTPKELRRLDDRAGVGPLRLPV